MHYAPKDGWPTISNVRLGMVGRGRRMGDGAALASLGHRGVVVYGL